MRFDDGVNRNDINRIQPGKENQQMAEWRDVTDSFTEEQRHYKNTYLEQDEVYDEVVELSIFSSPDDQYEIYFSYGKFYGIVYADPEEAYEIRDNMKKDLADSYNSTKEPTGEFINWFGEKYHVSLPNDLFFDFDLSSFF